MFMSNSRLKNQRILSKNETPSSVNISDQRKDLTPKGYKPNKFSSIFSNSKIPPTDKSNISDSYTRMETRLKIDRPLSSKNTESQKKYFSSKENLEISKKKDLSNYSSNKLIQNHEKNRSSHIIPPRSKSRSPHKFDDEIIRQQIFIVPKKYTITARDIKHYNNPRPNIPKNVQQMPNYQPAKHSLKSNGIIKCYSACTNQGPVRQYNEDRVAIILNISKPEHVSDWKKAAYFGVFDGHGGVDCADYLRDTLHTFLIKEKSFPNNIPEAISQSFHKCQNSFLERSKNMTNVDKSGSCGIVVFIYGDTCYVTNVGDSRAIMSSYGGQRISQLSIDHKPSDQYEQKRIIESGGRIYQTKLQNANPNINISYQGQDLPFILGPHRVLPGRLSVTRTFGDIQAKLPQYGGNPKAIISTPQIRSFKLTNENDFIILASDGIYDKLTNAQIIQAVWQTAKQKFKYKTVHEFCGLAVENIMRLAIHKKTLDNITVVIIGFQNLENVLFPAQNKPLEIKVEAQKKDSPKIIKSTSYLQNSSIQFYKTNNEKKVAKVEKKKETITSYSFLQKKPMKKQVNQSNNSPSSANGYRSFSYYKT